MLTADPKPKLKRCQQQQTKEKRKRLQFDFVDYLHRHYLINISVILDPEKETLSSTRQLLLKRVFSTSKLRSKLIYYSDSLIFVFVFLDRKRKLFYFF